MISEDKYARRGRLKVRWLTVWTRICKLLPTTKYFEPDSLIENWDIALLSG